MEIKNILLSSIAASTLFAFGSQASNASANSWKHGIPKKFKNTTYKSKFYSGPSSNQIIFNAGKKFITFHSLQSVGVDGHKVSYTKFSDYYLFKVKGKDPGYILVQEFNKHKLKVSMKSTFMSKHDSFNGSGETLHKTK